MNQNKIWSILTKLGLVMFTNNVMAMDPENTLSMVKDQVKLKIHEPHSHSYIRGGSFPVDVEIDIIDDSLTRESLLLCTSLDLDPWFCWPSSSTSGMRVYYTDTIEGSHDLKAKLCHNIQKEDGSHWIKPLHKHEVSNFVNLYNPVALIESLNLHDSRHTPIPEGMLVHDYLNNLTRALMPEDEISLEVPVVKFESPSWNSTVVGSTVQVTLDFLNFPHKNADPIEMRRAFQIWFRHAFVCINVDAGSSNACYRLYDENTLTGDDSKRTVSFLVTGLHPGLHTLAASISRPDTGELTTESFSGNLVFYTI